jgi:hypothetical protein
MSIFHDVVLTTVSAFPSPSRAGHRPARRHVKPSSRRCRSTPPSPVRPSRSSPVRRLLSIHAATLRSVAERRLAVVPRRRAAGAAPRASSATLDVALWAAMQVAARLGPANVRCRCGRGSLSVTPGTERAGHQVTV